MAVWQIGPVPGNWYNNWYVLLLFTLFYLRNSPKAVSKGSPRTLMHAQAPLAEGGMLHGPSQSAYLGGSLQGIIWSDEMLWNIVNNSHSGRQRKGSLYTSLWPETVSLICRNPCSQLRIMSTCMICVGKENYQMPWRIYFITKIICAMTLNLISKSNWKIGLHFIAGFEAR